MKGGRLTGLRLLCQITLLALGFVTSAQAGPKLDTSNPLGFFTNLASRLLQSELNLSLTRIQIYPTNQYTPAVHRLLQITANILDATTNRFNTNYPYLPSVFRPVFTNDGGSIFIRGYEEAGTNALTNAWRDSNLSADRDALQANDYVYGIPVVIGAKKGFPNFNEFAMQTVFQITRRLEIRRPSLMAPQSQWTTNTMYVLGISNIIGAEAWNSYRSNYTRPVDIYVTNYMSMTLTNDYGLSMTLNPVIGRYFTIPNPTNAVWPGFNGFNPNPSFVIPLKTNVIFLPDSAFLPGLGFTTNWAIAWDTSQTFRIPKWGLAVTNRLLLSIIDHDTQRLVDLVLLKDLNGARDLSEETRDLDNAIGFSGLWSTNLLSGYLTQGIFNQISISLGVSGASTADWKPYDLGSHVTKDFEIDYFRALYGLTGFKYPFLVNTSLVQQVPFTPTKRISQYLTWQVNDPLVHYLAPTSGIVRENLGSPVQPVKNIGFLNERYQPWGGNPYQSIDPNRFSLTLKDPLIRTSDDWSFPDSELLCFGLLGRVHRGTPWQTIYLKWAGVDAATWTNWIGISGIGAAALTMPTNDWHLAALLVSLLNTNSPRQLLSINDPKADAWLNALEGLSVLTNSSTDVQLGGLPPTVLFDTLVMTSNSPQAALIADAIQQARERQSGQYYRGLGDILAVPELTTNSPWLNLSSAIQVQRGISDEAYEKIPAQLLTRLRPDSIGSLLQTGGTLHIQFTGFDDYPYSVEVSSNLLDWFSVSTNYPTNGVFEFVEPTAAENERRFYRSVLLP